MLQIVLVDVQIILFLINALATFKDHFRRYISMLTFPPPHQFTLATFQSVSINDKVLLRGIIICTGLQTLEQVL